MNTRILLMAVFAAVFPQLSSSQVKATSGPVTIGVRTDAPPFVWRNDQTGSYVGFFYDICTLAVKRAGYMFEEKDVDATKRKAFFEGNGGNYNLLCDPTTVTLERLRHFIDRKGLSHLQFSPILFVANGSYMSLDASQPTDKGFFDVRDEDKNKENCERLIDATWTPPSGKPPEQEKSCGEYFGDPFSGTKLKNCLSSKIQLRPSPPDPMRITTGEIWGYVKGATIKDHVDAVAQDQWDDGEGKLICEKSLDTHKQAVELFCTGHLARYYGDLDIIRAAISEYVKTGKPCSYTEPPEQERTYEPYALVLSSSELHPDFPERFVHSLYGMFYDGTVQKLYEVNFPGTTPTTYLDKLFQINQVPLGK
ncbi:transporter substrate-binding domain-containing protein [Ruegeria jejuensis]|uniref:transporter substrate-binding domain-containing protein n=1 Tax=Ruegeria jejuensis TaxID=3233338 RepID=UPI00355BBDFE